MTIWDLQEGGSASVSDFATHIPHAYRQRLIDLGFTPQREIKCLKTLPFGGPKVIAVGASVYSMSKELAQCLFIEITKPI